MAKISFEDWKKEVSQIMLRRLGVGPDDLPDYRYRDDYEEGITPQRAAARAIKAAKREMGL